jgi:hypothetical protein
VRDTILIISCSFLNRDPRVLRQIKVLSSEFDIVACGLSNPDIEGINYIKAPLKAKNTIWQTIYEASLVFLKFDLYLYQRSTYEKEVYNCVLNYFTKAKPGLIICNDIQFLPLSVKLKALWNIKLIVDFHEFAPSELEDILLWRLRFKGHYTRILKKMLPKVDIVTTVCNGIKQRFFDEFNVNSHVILNSPEYVDLLPKATNYSCIQLVHHGGAIRSRHLEIMIEMMDYLDPKFELNLILIETDPGYIQELKQLCKNKRVNFLPSVPTDEISMAINKFDIGLFILPPVNFNYKMALPNKFFEFIQARLCIAIGPSQEMEFITNKYKLGIVSPDFSAKSMADLLNNLSSADILLFKNNAHKYAEELSFNHSKQIILNHTKALIH